jgi:DNA-directed RNA polymerase subunit F
MTMETVKRQAEIIHDLRERLAVAERLVRVDTALARQLSESIRTMRGIAPRSSRSLIS